MCAVSAQPLQNSLEYSEGAEQQQYTKTTWSSKGLVCFSLKSMCTNLQKSGDGFSERQSRTLGPPVLC